jgi:hypothetical protein
LIGGQLLQRWTNDYFFATPNRSGGQRPEISPHRICAGRAKGDRLDAARYRRCAGAQKR